jgi:hypothetical protein
LFVVTVRTAPLLVMVPNVFRTTARNTAPLSDSCAALMLYVAAVAPGMSTPLRCHWYVSGVEPDAPTKKATAVPGWTIWLTGCVVMLGGRGPYWMRRRMPVAVPVPRIR